MMCVVLTLTASPPLSATCVVKILVPAVVGVPLSVQSPLSVVPAEALPLSRLHVCGGRPPLGTQATWLYATPTSPFGGAHVADSGPRFTASCRSWSSNPPTASVTRTVNGVKPRTADVPLMTPVTL